MLKLRFSLKSHLGKFQNIVDSNPGKLSKTMPFVTFILAFALGFYLFFVRYPIFHDEIINTYKASTGLIFDYALRPVFYFLNYIFYHFLGGSPRSLTVAAVFYFAVTAMMLYLSGSKFYGLAGGLLCSFIFMSYPMVIQSGIRGMPHLPAGMFSALLLYFLSVIFTSSSAKKSALIVIAIGITGVIMLATHPTMMGIAFALVVWALIGWIFNGRYFSIFYPGILKRRHYVLLFATLVVSLSVLNILYLYFDGRSYVSILLAGIGKTNNSVYSGYHQPWFWYFTTLAKQGNPMNILLPLLILCFFLLVFAERRKTEWTSPTLKFIFTVLVTGMIFLISISMSKWKFERVLVSFSPFYALSAGLALGFLAKWSIRNLNAAIYSILLFLIMIFVVVWGVVSFSDYAGIRKKNADLDKENYYGLYDQVLNINAPDIGVIGNKAQQIFAMRYITLAGKSPVKVADGLGALNNDEGSAALTNALMAGKVEYFLIPTGRKSASGTVSQDYINAFHRLVSIGAARFYSWRGLYELWRFETIPQSSDFYKCLSIANPSTRIGVYGTKNEVDEEHYGWYDFIAGKFNLRIYPLISNRRTAEENMGYLYRNDVPLLLIPSKEMGSLQKDKINDMKEFLKTHAWSYVDTDEKLGLELWIMGSN